MGKTKIAERSALAKNIISRRNAKGWNQGDLAHAVGVHINTIKSIETDDNEGSRENRQAIAQALDCTLSDLYREAEDVPTPSNYGEAGAFLSRLAALPLPYQRVILALVYKDPELVRGTVSDSLQRPLQALLKAL